MRKLNLFECELGERVEHGTVANRGTRLGPLLGAQRIGAGLYEIDDGRWVWPYHYHHGVEEWLYVVAGSPVLRDPNGQRTLCAGDFVCFPSGYGGAHSVGGPGRVVLFSVGGWPDASIAVYPDSDKIGTRPGDAAPPGLDRLNFRRAEAVDYWDGEGHDEAAQRRGPAERPEPVERSKPAERPEPVERSKPAERPEPVRAPDGAPRRPVYNGATLEATAPEHEEPDGFRRRVRRLGKLLGAERLAGTICELDPGQGGAPYHCEHGREEWLLVLTGTPLLRHAEGEDRLEPGDLVCLPDGLAGARRLTNPGPGTARAVFLSTGDVPSVREYLDKRAMMVRYSREHDAFIFPVPDFSYWEGGLV